MGGSILVSAEKQFLLNILPVIGEHLRPRHKFMLKQCVTSLSYRIS